MDSVASTQHKALELNLDPTTYGSFAEIGAGQEVARWFFQVGGAARTVAKTISAYDMAVSDSLYGSAQRYVSRHRLEAMLEHEFGQLRDSLGPRRGESSTFFAFADTVATRRRGHDENGRGWVGVCFQSRPLEEPSRIIVHAHLLDHGSVAEQEALGILGVNLIHAAFFRRADLASLIDSLMDDLSRERVEIDMIKVSGPAFAGVDNRLLSLQLVEHRLTDAAMFTASGEVVQPSEVLYNRPILVERGSFRPATKLTMDLLERARTRFCDEPEVRGLEPVVLAEMTLRNLTVNDQVGPEDFLARADVLHALGIDVLVSRFRPFYQLADYLAAYTDRMIGLALGVPTMREILDEQYYEKLDGGALESIGRLFKRSVKLYVYPTRDRVSGEIVTVHSAAPPGPAHYLRDFLLEVGRLEALSGYEPKLLSIHTPDVLARLQAGDPSWEAMVPSAVADCIKTSRLFGYRG
ncbi:MAG: hypothetical protein JWN44_5368 [Myxococcales bacterium]|nr:hypothetical protein [Myxococcales bacterium]